ncbi:MAG: hypothetical protein GKS05_12635 [Nitrospirales bacterium]|nr:hypothetical protein [Nitrospirales bacterium]
MRNRIFGLETEYGLLIHEDATIRSPSWLTRHLIDHVFHTTRNGIIDLHYRGHDEPPGNGGFLTNAGRLYVDMGHLEFATPECHTLSDLVAFSRAGDQILQTALQELGLEDHVSFIKNNIDHETNATFGSHENYLVTRNFPFNLEGLTKLIPFLVTRQIFTGAGRIGRAQSIDGWIPIDSLHPHITAAARPLIPFQISQRADHIVTDFFEWIQHSRAIINTRDEPLADPNQFRRIHLLLGDSNMSEIATALKFGTTGLMLQLIEDQHIPEGLDIDEPVQILRDISCDPERAWVVTLASGKTMSAVDIQEQYLQAAQKYCRGQDEETDWVLEQWEGVLTDLRGEYTRLVGRVDWASKLWLLDSFRKEEQVGWDDPWLKSLDLEYHNIYRDKGLYFGLEDEGQAIRMVTDPAVDIAMHHPPRNTRAFGRGELVRHLVNQSSHDRPLHSTSSTRDLDYVIHWSAFQVRGHPPFRMPNPFKTYTQAVREHLSDCPTDVSG